MQLRLMNSPYTIVHGLAWSLTTISYPVEAGAKRLFTKWESWHFSKRLITQLQALDAEEKGILKSFMQRRTQYFDFENGAVAALVGRGILFRPLEMADIRRFPATITDWAWELLRKHPELLQ
jgi:Super-infection exclusion protein B